MGSPGDDRIRGTRGPDVVVAKGGDDDITTLEGNDVVCTGRGDDTISAGPGADRLSGGGGQDFLAGDEGDDLLHGGDGPDFLAGLKGDDETHGDAGLDIGIFAFAPGPVEVDLSAGSATGEGHDSLSGIESVLGSDFNDSILGDDRANALGGGPGDDLLDGREGETDVAFYVLSEGPVTVDLDAQTAAGGDGSDRLTSIEGAFGSLHDDTLLGTSEADQLLGSEGNDTIDGRGGTDVCVGETVSNCPSSEPPASAPESGDPPSDPPESLARAMTSIRPRATTLNLRGSHMCNWSDGGASIPYSSVTVLPPSLSASGNVSWRPILVLEVAGGYVNDYGSWSQPTYGGSNWPTYTFMVDRGYAGRSRAAVYHEVYDWDSGTYSHHWSAALFMNPATGQFFDGGYYCAP